MTVLDILSLVWFAGTLGLFEIALRIERLAARSLTASVQEQRRRWIANMAKREQRQYDAILMSNLTQSLAFFASTSVLGIGGLAAILGYGDQAQQLLEQIPYVARATPAVWEIKILFLMGILIYAFFKFAWAFRLSHYTVITFGAMPASDHPDTLERARYVEQIADLLGLVGDHANAGLRSFYYAFAAIAWFFHPLLFIASATLVTLVLLRREFLSRASRILRKVHAPG
ncbi:MAG: DUF599 family protein [Hyphomicrobiaceae bacterium]|nr:DUF599 family protein [Hyphomicrobiaceae bacterium]